MLLRLAADKEEGRGWSAVKLVLVALDVPF